MENKSDEQNELQMYLQFLNKSKHSFPLLSMLIINSVVNVCGIILNAFLIITTIKNRSLHSFCNVLIALQCFCSIFGFFVFFLPFSVIFWPISDQRTFFSYSSCFYVQSILLSFTVIIFTLMLSISFDRMLCVFVPIWYKKRNAKYYSAILCAFSVPYPIYTIHLLYKNLMAQPKNLTFCTMGSSLGQEGVKKASFADICIIYLSTICYLLLYAKLKWNERKANGKSIISQFSILKSISVILLLQVVGWSGGIIAFFVAAIVYGQSDLNVDKFLANSFINCFVCLCATFEAPVFYLNSSEHKKAMRKECKSIIQLLKKHFSLLFGRANKIGISPVVLMVTPPSNGKAARERSAFRPLNLRAETQQRLF